MEYVDGDWGNDEPGGIDKLATEPVGTGPYQLKQFSTGEFIALEPNRDYWGEQAESDVTISYYPMR